MATTAPPGYDIARRDQNNGRTVFDFSVRVTDNDGEYADLPMRVTVVNVNRPPVLLASPAQISEGAPLAWSDFTLADPDPYATNSPEQPERVVPRPNDTARVVDGRLVLTLPPVSWGAVRLAADADRARAL